MSAPLVGVPTAPCTLPVLNGQLSSAVLSDRHCDYREYRPCVTGLSEECRGSSCVMGAVSCK